MRKSQLAFVGSEEHGLKRRPLARGTWRGVCTCTRMPVADTSAQSVVQAWRRHVEEEAQAAGVEPQFVRPAALKEAAKRARRIKKETGS